MEIFFWGVLWSIFLYLNFLIIRKDIKEKIIPNKFLLYLFALLPFWYLYIWYFEYFETMNLLNFALQISITLILSFALFHFWMWGAGDAKYLFVLSFFIPHVQVYIFIVHISLITFCFLIFQALTYFFKLLLSSKEKQNIYTVFKEDFSFLSLKKDNFLQSWKYEIVSFIIYLIMIFLFFRIIRYEIFHTFLWTTDIIKYNSMILFVGFCWGIGMIKIIEFIRNAFYYIFCTHYKITKRKAQSLFFFSVSFFIGLILIDIAIYIDVKEYFEIYKYMIFSSIIYLCFKILFYIFHIFSLNKSMIHETFEIKAWYQIDKKTLWYYLEKKELEIKKIYDEGKLNGKKYSEMLEMISFLKKVEKELQQEDVKIIQNYAQKIDIKIPISPTFAFSPFLFLGCVSSFIFWGKLLYFFYWVFLILLKNIS